MKFKRKYPIGAEITKTGVHFRVWAPDHDQVFVVLEDTETRNHPFPMQKEKDGYYSLLIPQIGADTHYRFQLGKSDKLVTDPASRFQPYGPAGPSAVVNPAYDWSDQKWPGISKEGQIIYEMHIGTFTKEGTFKAAMAQLKELADLGITLIELMPINDFPGHFGWGYDGVNLYAPTRLYGSPSNVKAFIDKAHSLGLGVILDIVYNHLGPDYNQVIDFSKDYFSKETTDWGTSLNFDSPFVREFFLTNARYWIEEFHFDGLRVDATSCLYSSTPIHILADLTYAARDAAGQRQIVVIGENEPQNTALLRPYDEGGYDFDALWNDDFHHTACVRLTGKREAYYVDYLGSPQEFISAIKYGFLYQGQYYDWQKQNRGTPALDLPSTSFVIFLENHDQVANSLYGKRIHQLADPGIYKAMTCLLLLTSNTPMLFQGQEFASSKPFYYFADHSDYINSLIKKGRKEFLSQFPRIANREAYKSLITPSDPLTFTDCKLDFSERYTNAAYYAMHRDLIKLRKEDPVFQNMVELTIDGAVLGSDSFLIRYFGGELGDRLLIINFGCDHYFNPAPEPLLVAGQGKEWEILWSSESVAYSGGGTPPINIPYWKIVGHSAIVLGEKTQNLNKKKL